MTVFKFRVSQLDTHGHFEVYVGDNEDVLGYAGSMILRKDELIDLIDRIAVGQEDNEGNDIEVLSLDTSKEIRLELYG